MSKYVITPWRTQKDLLDVRQQLYATDSQSTQSQRYAVDRVMAWKLRGNLPHAVESTALLVDASLHHNAQINSSFADQAVYSAAFCRFVTGFCDIGRSKERTLEPSSMLDIAKQIGMPPEFVALRHEATHEELPNIQRLVTASRQALDWLWNVYWSRLQEPQDLAAISAALTALKTESSTLLKRYRKSRREVIINHWYEKPERVEETRQICSHLAQSCDNDMKRAAAVAEVLVDERLIIPSNRELGASLEGAKLIWDDFICELPNHIPGFLHIFATRLMDSLVKPSTVVPQNDAEKEALASWLLYTCDLERRIDGGKSIKRDIVKRCCLYPGHWTQYVGREALAYEPDLSVDWRDLLEAASLQADDEARHIPQDGDEARNVPVEEGITMSTADHIDQSAETKVEGGWTRAIAPPSVPLGVVH